MHATPYQHTPVMAKESLFYLNPAPGKVFVDCTLGGGGHAQALLEKSKVIGFDQDKDAIAAAKIRLADYNNIEYINDNFSNLTRHVKEKVDGILFDLGVSSYQIDEQSRGFGFQKDGPLDMRMDQTKKLNAEDIINTYPVKELEKIFKEFGEERFAGRISREICTARQKNKIKTTFALKGIIEKSIPTWKKRESVARVFQSLRIYINNELDVLQKALGDAISLLNPGGRIVVISYHSLEDRIVKHTFRQCKEDGILTVLTKRPVIAEEAERAENPRSASAKLRAAEKR